MNNHIRVAFFLAIRQIKRSSLWTTFLIISIMILTFLNLVATSGVLVGLIEGAVSTIKTHYYADIFISTPRDKRFIENTPEILRVVASLPETEKFTTRYTEGGTIEANYKERIGTGKESEKVGTTIAGINPDQETDVTGIADLLIEGEYLLPNDYDQVVIGALLLREYLGFDSPSFATLKDVTVGSKVRITVGEASREMRVKGILRSKADEIDRRVFMTDTQLRSMIGRTDLSANEVAIRIRPDADPNTVRDAILATGAGEYALVQTYDESEPKFIKDMKQTFNLLGVMIGSIGIVVASITLFIIIFINALTRRKYIGILKGIGVSGGAIEIAYILISAFYATLGVSIGLFLTYFALVPYFEAYPINFPFSDGILVAPIGETLIRASVLMVMTLIAGYIPARMIVRKNTLDSILGRN